MDRFTHTDASETTSTRPQNTILLHHLGCNAKEIIKRTKASFGMSSAADNSSGNDVEVEMDVVDATEQQTFMTSDVSPPPTNDDSRGVAVRDFLKVVLPDGGDVDGKG